MVYASYISSQKVTPFFEEFTIEDGFSNSSLTDADLADIKKQIEKTRGYLFEELIDSVNFVLTPLLKELSDKNLLKSAEGLEARLLHVKILELNNTRGEALEEIFSLIDDCNAQEEWLLLSRIYLVAELAYEFLDKPDRCLYYFNQCKALIEAYDLTTVYPYYCNRLSTYYRIWGDRDSSYHYAEEALRTSKIWYEKQKGVFTKQVYEDLTTEYATAHNILGGLYKPDGNIKKATYHFQQSKLLWQNTELDFKISWAFLHLTWLYSYQKDYNTALLYSDSTLAYGVRIFDNWGILGKEIKSNILLEQARIYKALGQPDSLYQLLSDGYNAKIDVISARNNLHATEIEARHTDQQKAFKIEQQINQLDRERKWRLGLIGILAVFFVLAIGLVHFYQQLRKANIKTRLHAEELKILDKVKSKFFANISHELRTPLTLILGPLSYVLENPNEWEKENIQQQLLVMQRNGKSLMELIEEILDLSKLEAKKLELAEEGTPVRQFFEYLFFVFEPQFKSQGLDYELELNIKEDLHVLMDRKKMEKVLNNFLSNAIKFTPKGKKITLSVTESDAQLKIVVSDTGSGIHPNDLPHIFDRFYQSNQPDQQLYGGTGIGLALVSEFAQLMGGKAYAESTLGKGSNFFFDLPKKETTVPKMLFLSQSDPNELEQIDSIGSDFTILVVEDNNDMRNFIFELLRKKYKQILLAKNGAEGLELLEKYGTGIHLIVSDVMMPVVDGLTMLKEIKSNADWFGIPVVMLTALAAERDKLTALTIGVDDYLTKPFSVPELLIRVQNLLYNYHNRLDWQRSEELQIDKENDLKIEDPKRTLNHNDKKWIDELKNIVKDSLEEGKLDVEGLASLVFLSSRQLNRKIKSITGLSTAKFIKEVQLQAAREELENGTFISISEVANKFGFEYPSTFSNVFKNRFGKSPNEFI